MKQHVSWFALVSVVGFVATGLFAWPPVFAQARPLTHGGLEISVDRLERGNIVPLGDCPPGDNIVRGVIRRGDEGREFVTVHLKFKVLPGFTPVSWPRPAIHDVKDQVYRTAQVFADMNRTPEFSCNFSFRVPTGMKVKDLLIDNAPLDLTAFDRGGPAR